MMNASTLTNAAEAGKENEVAMQYSHSQDKSAISQSEDDLDDIRNDYRKYCAIP